MTTLFVATRVLHFLSALLPFGALVFAVVVATPWRKAHDEAASADVAYRYLDSLAPGALIVALASGVAWFLVEAATMSGVPLAKAIEGGALRIAAVETTFGRVWTMRLAVLVALAFLYWLLGRAAPRNRGIVAFAATIAAGAYLASLAWAGHAAAGLGADEPLQMAADAAHLLASGAWLGALPALVYFLKRAPRADGATHATRRFTNLGMTCVAVLIASGFVNASYLVGGVPALIGTSYGRLLLAKLALFAAMLALAIANRGFWAPRIARGDVDATRALRRNAQLETAAGIGVVVVVGILGISVPAIHQSPNWPFALTLSLDPVEGLPWRQLAFAALAAIPVIGVLALLKGALERPPHFRLAAIAAIVVPMPALAWLLGVPAHPTTYWASPVRYDADAIASGDALYARHCASCHGRDVDRQRTNAPRDGSAASLSSRVPTMREGDLFWTIAHGIPGTTMQPFTSRSSDADVWNLIQYLDAQAAATNALEMIDRVRPLRRVLAPDFAFERVGGAQEFFAVKGEQRVTLLAFYTLPDSLPRLRELARQAPALRAAGARIISLPIGAPANAVDIGEAASAESILANASPDVANVYAMFARSAEGTTKGVPSHMEFLADRYRDLRVRWIGVPAEADRGAQTLRQVEILVREPPREPIAWGHRH